MKISQNRANKAAQQVLNTCHDERISTVFANEAAEHTKKLINNYDVLIFDAIRSGLSVAVARQAALDSKNRTHLRLVKFFRDRQ